MQPNSIWVVSLTKSAKTKTTNPMMIDCIHCGLEVNPDRAALGYGSCIHCGDIDAKKARESWCVAPLHKSNYTLITNLDDLKGINNKGGLVK